jgi:hypothetical protein
MLSMSLLVSCVGLGVFGAILLVVIVVVLSRREDFVHPVSGRKSDPQPVREVSVEALKNIPSNPHFLSIEDQEQVLVDWLLAQASEQTGVNLTGDQMVQDRMVNAVRNAMKDLDGQDSTTISLPFLTADGSGPKHFEMTFTRQMMDQIQ